ncbi:MAG TPA: hypothetical protein ENN66_03980 [Proteobacteria bacterium]|nr:hypothetical protein [Pseudomonadota bacterium]
MRWRLVLFLSCSLFCISIWGGGWFHSVSADEYDDARVAFGAFEDGLYDFAGQELERFLKNHSTSKMVGRVRLTLLLCALELGDCGRAAELFHVVRKSSTPAELGIEPARLQLQLAFCRLAQGNRAEARRCLHELLEEYAESASVPEARLALARIYFADQDFAAANREITPLVESVGAEQKRVEALGRHEINWIAAFSRYQIQDYPGGLAAQQSILARLDDYAFSPVELQEFFVMVIDSAGHCRAQPTVKTILELWLQLPDGILLPDKLSAALQEALRLEPELGQAVWLEPALVRVVKFSLPVAEKIIFYRYLIEMARQRQDEDVLCRRLNEILSLLPSSHQQRIAYLRSLLWLEYRRQHLSEVVKVGRNLVDEDKNFWREELVFAPYLNALAAVGDCAEFVRYVPSALPPVSPEQEPDPTRFGFDLTAGRCLRKMGRERDAAVFFRSIYKYYSSPRKRLQLLSELYLVAAADGARLETEDWIRTEVKAHFPLDRRENEELLRSYPELVLLVAEQFFREKAYAQAQPSLLWLETLSLGPELVDRVTFFLAESFHRSQESGEAWPRYLALYKNNESNFRYLAALRLVTYYEGQGETVELAKLYRDLLAWEKDPLVAREFKRKLKALPQ